MRVQVNGCKQQLGPRSQPEAVGFYLVNSLQKRSVASLRIWRCIVSSLSTRKKVRLGSRIFYLLHHGEEKERIALKVRPIGNLENVAGQSMLMLIRPRKK